MDDEIKEIIRFVLEDGNEGMRAALDKESDLDEENKQLNRELIKRHEQILAKLARDDVPSQEDWVLVREASEIHVNDGLDLAGHHQKALALEAWLDKMMELSLAEAMKVLEGYLDRDPKVPARVYWALHTLSEEATSNGAIEKAAFDEAGRCLACGSRVSLADVTDTVVFAGDEIVKRYPGDITNRNCVRCTYPRQYAEYEDYEKGDAR